MNALVITAAAAPLRVSVARYFEERGFATFLVSSAEVALLLAAAVSIEVAFVDAAALGESSRELVARLRELCPGVRVVRVRDIGDVAGDEPDAADTLPADATAVPLPSAPERVLGPTPSPAQARAAIDAVLATSAQARAARRHRPCTGAC